jgi:hypothetical protein
MDYNNILDKSHNIVLLYISEDLAVAVRYGPV